MSTSNSYLFTSFSSSSSSSSSDSESDDEKIVTLLGVYEINNASMIQILQLTDRSKKRGPIYSPATFRRRFRMRHPLYLRILNAIEAHDPYFVQKQDTAHILGLSPLQMMTSAMRILSYRVTVDAVDDNIRIEGSTAIQNLQHFCNSVIEIFGPKYLRSPTSTDIARLLVIGEVRWEV
ncbi:uncharacterized protein LOC114304377 [Camellia sinensis]|uniref:uncharacterized protein LOC114304377 n=1 Tax=Camellia sinensis TaxID=4442 RepID=UPI001036743C|nr:uncharacterized protein LOC114304377 [Camellia sinensis]